MGVLNHYNTFSREFQGKNIMLNKFFTETMDFYGIKGSDLADKVGCSRNNISEIRKGKVHPPTSKLWELLEACEELAPGFKEKFAEKVAGRYYFKRNSTINNSNFENNHSFIFQFNGTAEQISSQLQEVPPEAFHEILRAILLKMSNDISPNYSKVN
jgi:transcriptional regulator with XRE-family HTH domain